MSEKNMATNEDQLMGSTSIFWIFLSLNVFFFWGGEFVFEYIFVLHYKINYTKAEKAKRCKTHIIGYGPRSPNLSESR